MRQCFKFKIEYRFSGKGVCIQQKYNSVSWRRKKLNVARSSHKNRKRLKEKMHGIPRVRFSETAWPFDVTFRLNICHQHLPPKQIEDLNQIHQSDFVCYSKIPFHRFKTRGNRGMRRDERNSVKRQMNDELFWLIFLAYSKQVVLEWAMLEICKHLPTVTHHHVLNRTTQKWKSKLGWKRGIRWMSAFHWFSNISRSFDQANFCQGGSRRPENGNPSRHNLSSLSAFERLFVASRKNLNINGTLVLAEKKQ